jgi:2,4-dienoyl-CoA reductase-like NADH-dependent reductase (Old Yellow Enzyme family)
MPGLLDPITIKGLEIPNRLVMPPMATRFATETGEATDRLVAHYSDRAGGVGLVIIEHCFVMVEGRMRLDQPGIHGDELIPGLTRLVQAVHRQGAKIAVQINHGGSKVPADAELRLPVGPSPVPFPGSEIRPRELGVPEIRRIVEAFGEAARRARAAGFDAVEVHGAHGFLNNQFLSPLTNRRSDRYGGTLENRLRLPVEIVGEVLRKAGGDTPLLYRLGAEDFMDGGLSIEEGVKAAEALVRAGVDALDVSGGLGGYAHPAIDGQGFMIPAAERVKAAVPVPVIGVGGITEPKFADQVIREGRVDMVAVGRAMLSDPSWARRAVDFLSE